MPVGRSFINGSPVLNHGNGGGGNGGVVMDGNRSFDFKRSSPLKPDTLSNSTQLTTSEGFPLPIPKSLTSQFRASPLNHSTTFSHSQLSVIHDDSQDQEPRFFCQPKNLLNLYDYNKKTGTNYFQVTASLIIPGHSDQTYYALQLNPADSGSMQPIQQFFLRLKACTSTSSSPSESNESIGTVLENHSMVRPVALTQMTPKRDKGPQREPPTIPITPSDSVFGNEQVCVTFERLQFRVATANNGKRRASQQYFRLIFELVAQLDDGSQHVVSECYSSPLVVRGRSPGHYSSEPQRDVRKKRKLTPPPPPTQTSQAPSLLKIGSTSPSTTASSLMGASAAIASTASPSSPPSLVPPQQQPQHYQHVVTLPPPQYVYNSPSLVVDTQRTSSIDNTSSSSSVPNSAHSPISFHAQQQQQQQQQLMPHLMNSAFSNFHARSQSANDSELFARHRNNVKFQPVIDHHHHHQQQQQQQQQQGQQDDMFDNYDAGIERALRNWQQQVVRQRADSGATFDSYMSSSNEHDTSSSTRPGTPLPYQQQQQQQQQQQFYNPTSTHWASATTAAVVPHPPSLPSRHHYEEKYHQQQQDLSPKLYQQHSR
ncbi:hypothetical protein [Parasitella parasitica]|uniref:NDT80 domain-containing protein n=1 Tax=Parasitella parasitica TaxID=35722 RepID=A0A0B7MT82_9FUNG|nr:hypothetical protein [Parasitella parasitica]